MFCISSLVTSLKNKKSSFEQCTIIWIAMIVVLYVFPIPALAQAADIIVATIDGEAISQREVDDAVSSRILPVQRQLYALRKVALDNVITKRLLEKEATKNNTTVEEIRKKMMAGPVTVSAQEVDIEYTKNLAFFATMSPDEAKERLRLDLESRIRMKRLREALSKLRSSSSLVVNLVPPESQTVADDQSSSPLRGSKGAPVTIVEFSDFECRFCGLVQPTLKQVLEEYGDQVGLVFKYLPSESRVNSITAARAAYCAGKQNRFWEFHDALFAAHSRDPSALSDLARSFGLRTDQFTACQQSEESRLMVMREVEAARAQKIDSTPSFVINDTLVSGAISFADFQRIIDRELHRSSPKASSSN